MPSLRPHTILADTSTFVPLPLIQISDIQTDLTLNLGVPCSTTVPVGHPGGGADGLEESDTGPGFWVTLSVSVRVRTLLSGLTVESRQLSCSRGAQSVL